MKIIKKYKIMNRRHFIKLSAGLPLYTTALGALFASPLLADEPANKFKNFEDIKNAVLENKWNELPINELMIKIGKLFIDVPYTAYTLESPGPETCRISFDGLDCVTFYESVLVLARIFKKGKFSIYDLNNEMIFVRYREGKLTDYTSRLHYTSDWIYDNVRKGVVENITSDIGGTQLPVEVRFMSKNPEKYAALKDNPKFVEVIANIEDEINHRKHYFIITENLPKSVDLIKSGDIICLATSSKDLDYSHTGLAYRDESGVLRFFHASSQKKKVVIDDSLVNYLATRKRDIGITVVRPLEP
jgi:hypothetical protein